jgi:hypothetical protein
MRKWLTIILLFLSCIGMMKVVFLLDDVQALVVETKERLVYTSQDLNAVLLHTDQVVGNVARLSEQQAHIGKKSLEVLDNVNVVLRRTDQVLTQVQDATEHIDSATVATLQDLQPVLSQSRNTLVDLDRLVSDPSLKKSLDNTAAITANAVTATNNVALTTARIDHKVEQMLKPVSLIKRIASTVLQEAASLKTLFF